MLSDFVKFWPSRDMKEKIILMNGEYILVNDEIKKANDLGKTVEEARKTLQRLGKVDIFPTF